MWQVQRSWAPGGLRHSAVADRWSPLKPYVDIDVDVDEGDASLFADALPDEPSADDLGGGSDHEERDRSKDVHRRTR